MEKSGNPRMHSLDVLRGIAALVVVVWHWQHLYLLGQTKLTLPFASEAFRSSQPFYIILKPLYERGYFAVDMFFILSGFVFFSIYKQKIQDGRETAFEFAFARFSRLYPLHIAMLSVVAALQIAFMKESGQFFVYPANDAKHFLFSLFFIQSIKDGAAFNGPEWSLTIEIVLYVIFYVAARLGLLRRIHLPIAIFTFGLIFYTSFHEIPKGLCGFFLGGLLVSLHEAATVNSERSSKLFRAIAPTSFLAWAVVLTWIYAGPALHGDIERLATYLVLYTLFPATVLSALLFERIRGVHTRLEWLGEASYSSYLLHFPLQVGIALMFAHGLIGADSARSPLAFALFFLVLVPLSVFINRSFEIPVLKAMRRKCNVTS